MKTTTKCLLGGIIAAFLGSIGHAQIIYSNSFDGGPSTIDLTAPTVANSFIGTSAYLTGGTNTAVWEFTTNDSSFVYANGNIDGSGGTALLPFKPQLGDVYLMTASITIGGLGSQWLAMGFSTSCPTNPGTGPRFADSAVSGYAWMLIDSGVDDIFEGKDAATAVAGDFTSQPGTYNLEIVLNAVGSAWYTTAYINGTQLGPGTNTVFGSNPTIGFAGFGGTGLTSSEVPGVQWHYWALSTVTVPWIMTQPVSASVTEGAAFTNKVSAVADTNGGALFYQWYTNGVPVANATNSTLIFNPVSTADAGTNLYVIVTNTWGAVTSSIVSLTVYSSPVLVNQLPETYTNLFTLYAGANPRFSLSVNGTTPLYYKWFTNGVLDSAATTNSLQIANPQTGTYSNFCIVSNSLGAVTSAVWTAQVIADPSNSTGGLAPYPQSVLALNPIGYWRMNDTNLDGPDNLNGDDGYVCHDYAGGNDGIFTNVALGYQGYDPGQDPSDTSAQLGEESPTDFGDSLAMGIQGINFGAPSGTSVAFTVEAWVSGYPQNNDDGIVTLGWGSGGEQFNLDCGSDTPPTSHGFRFFIRDAQGNTHGVSSTVEPSTVGQGPWYYLVAVVDEISNQTVTLYINGQNVGSASCPSGSGILESSYPMGIGSRMSSQVSNFGDQFDGNINDVSVFNYALSQNQVVAEYQAAGGTVVPFFLPPLPPTNIVLTATNTTLTISASAFGTPPTGYYWTNLTTDAVLGEGTTNVLATLNATLTIPNISPNWWGEQLALVVANAAGSTNWFVTISPPLPPPETLGYTNAIVYSNSFDAGTVTVNGMAATAANELVGGTNSVWICTFTNGSSLSGTVYANGTLGTNPSCALLPFTPEPGYIYTMTASLTAPSSMYDWVAMGFTQLATQTNNANGTFSRFTDDPPNGYAWMYVQNSSGVFEPGPRTTVAGIGIGSVPLPSATPITLQIILNTITNNGWVASSSVNGVGIGTNVYTSNLPIGFAGIGQNQFAGSPPTGIQWNYWSLSAQAVSVAPYLLAPLPPASITLTNSTVSIPATAFGSGPFGYTWTFNNSTVLASGATNEMAPLRANLSVPSSSLGGGQLELTLTNAYGTNVTLVTLVPPVNTNPIPIGATVTNDNLYLTWPADHIGWQLQAQTNSLNVGINNNWVNYNPSNGTNRVVIPMNLTNGTVFFRLLYTP